MLHYIFLCNCYGQTQGVSHIASFPGSSPKTCHFVVDHGEVLGVQPGNEAIITNTCMAIAMACWFERQSVDVVVNCVQVYIILH